MKKSNEESRTRITIDMTPSELKSFLERLAYDDDFRRRLEGNPAEVLTEHGIHAPDKFFPDRVELAPKERFVELLEGADLGLDFLNEPDVRGLRFLAAHAWFMFLLSTGRR